MRGRNTVICCFCSVCYPLSFISLSSMIPQTNIIIIVFYSLTWLVNFVTFLFHFKWEIGNNSQSHTYTHTHKREQVCDGNVIVAQPDKIFLSIRSFKKAFGTLVISLGLFSIFSIFSTVALLCVYRLTIQGKRASPTLLWRKSPGAFVVNLRISLSLSPLEIFNTEKHIDVGHR